MRLRVNLSRISRSEARAFTPSFQLRTAPFVKTRGSCCNIGFGIFVMGFKAPKDSEFSFVLARGDLSAVVWL